MSSSFLRGSDSYTGSLFNNAGFVITVVSGVKTEALDEVRTLKGNVRMSLDLKKCVSDYGQYSLYDSEKLGCYFQEGACYRSPGPKQKMLGDTHVWL